MPTDLWAYLRPERPALACGGAALLVSTFSNAFAPRAMGRVVGPYAARRRDGGAALRRELAATGLVFACGALASGVRTACFAGACQGALRRLRADAYRACLVRRRGAHDAAAAADAVDADADAARFLTESLQNGLRRALGRQRRRAPRPPLAEFVPSCRGAARRRGARARERRAA